MDDSEGTKTRPASKSSYNLPKLMSEHDSCTTPFHILHHIGLTLFPTGET